MKWKIEIITLKKSTLLFEMVKGKTSQIVKQMRMQIMTFFIPDSSKNKPKKDKIAATNANAKHAIIIPIEYCNNKP